MTGAILMTAAFAFLSSTIATIGNFAISRDFSDYEWDQDADILLDSAIRVNWLKHKSRGVIGMGLGPPVVELYRQLKILGALDGIHPGNGVAFDNQSETIVLSGTVRDSDGEPLADAHVVLGKRVSEFGRVRVEGDNSTDTDDLGQYRFHGLEPGRYYISVETGSTGWDRVIPPTISILPAVSLGASICRRWTEQSTKSSNVTKSFAPLSRRLRESR